MIETVKIFYIGICIYAVGSSTNGQYFGPQVQVAQGELRGRYVTSQATGKDFYSFQGVPYAKPPLDDLRFRDAVPPEPWDGTYDATKTASECMQLSNSNEPEGSEDCLYLNVYTPQLPSAQSSLLPVMFWIHGGGFVTGSGSDDVFGPDYFVAEGVVLVTINYRLNCFGFLFMKDVAPGNAGLKDQVAALRWVNENIAAFNGDPKQITVFGESAGGVSSHWFMLTPMTKGLFQQGLSFSGTAFDSWSQMENSLAKTRRLAKEFDCKGSSRDIIDCLRAQKARDILEVGMTKAPTEADRDRFLPYYFVPTWEEQRVVGVETFVTAPPAQLIRKQHDLPFLTGFNDAEWMLDVLHNRSLFSSEESLKKLDSDWKKYIYPETLLPENLSNRVIAQAMGDLKKFYLDGKDLTFDNLQGYKNMLSDLQFVEGIMYGAKFTAKTKKSPVYLFHFTVDDQLNFLKKTFNLSGPGAAHADDLGYMFNIKSLPTVSDDSPAGLVRKRMVRMWTNFAKTGKPIPKTDDLLDVEWKPFDENKRNYLKIGENLEAGSDLFKKRSEFYEKFYKKYGARGEDSSLCGPNKNLLTSIVLYPYCVFY